MNAYPEYKESGIDWLGKIPSHWNKLRFKNFLTLEPKASASDKKIGLENIEGTTGRFIETASEFEGNGVAFEVGDIIYGKLRPYLKKTWIAEFNGNAVGDFFVFRANHNAYNQYCKWLFLSHGFTQTVSNSTEGAKMPRVSSAFILNMGFYLPPIDEQKAIAAYLDEKTGKIDELIAEKTKQVEDLRSFRTSVITVAVTRGLNPNVPLRQSGIDWLGEIPEHWNIIKTNYVFDNIGSGTTPDTNNDDYYSESGINWLQTGDLNDGYIECTSKHITDLAVTEKGLKRYPINSLVIAMYGATIAKLGILKIETTVNQACCVLTPSMTIENKYAFYVFHAGKNALIKLASGGGQPNISQAVIKEFRIPVPPISEQQEIAAYLDEKTAKIDKLISELNTQLAELAEYKQAVISEAVTGKVDVRDYKSSL
jgi:type I restriction enzyme S subunit